MLKILNFLKKDKFAISLIFIMVFSRLIPHPPNFTPIIAVAIMSGYLFKNFYLSFLVLTVSMVISDLFIGFYGNMIFVYFGLFPVIQDKTNLSTFTLCKFIFFSILQLLFTFIKLKIIFFSN